jgi:hypothetical protein
MIRAITVLAATALTLQGQPSGAGHEPLNATVKNPKVIRVLPIPEKGRTMFFLDFDVAIKNTRDTEVRIASKSATVYGAEVRLETGEWEKEPGGTLVWTEDMLDQPCSIVPPGGTHVLANLGTSLTLEDSNGHLPSKVTARFYMATVCREEGKAIPTNYALTEPVKIDLPAAKDETRPQGEK